MAQFIITYLGGERPAAPEAGKQHYAEYQAWLAAMGNIVVSPANPFKNTHTIQPNGTTSAGSTTHMSGYTIIEVASIDDALAQAKNCPFLNIGGSLEVSELIVM